MGRVSSAKKVKSKTKTQKKKKTRLESSDSDDGPAEPVHDQFKHSHEKAAKVIKADHSKWDNDWDKIERQRAEIGAIKEKKRISKMQNENDLKERNKRKKETEKKFARSAHEKDAKVIKADNSKWDNDWGKIEKQRAEIRAIKERKRRAKAE